MKNIFALLSILFIVTSLKSQNLIFNWQQCMGGSDSDMGYSIATSWNGNMLLCGTDSNNGQVPPNYGNGDFWLIRTDTMGAILWSHTYGGSGIDLADQLVTCPDGGFALSGTTSSNDGDVSGNHGDLDYWVIKVDSLGQIIWQKCIGGSGRDVLNYMILTPDSGFLITGGSTSIDGNVSGNHGFFDCWMVKLDRDGNLQWEKSLGSMGSDIGACVKPTNDGGYIVGATTDLTGGDVQCNLHGFIDSWIIKLDVTGNVKWQRCYGGTQGEGPKEILQTYDGGYIFAGSTKSNDCDVSGNHGENDIWVVKIDSMGSLQWQRCYGGSKDDVANFIRENANGSFIIGGYTFSNDGDVTGNHSYPTTNDAWLLRISPIGDVLWKQCIGGDELDNLIDILEFPNGKITLLGGSNTWDHSGDVQCESHGHSSSDVWLVGLTDTTVVGMGELPETSVLLKVYPNPAGDVLHFNLTGLAGFQDSKIMLFDIFGQVIREIILPSGKQEISISAANIPEGLYSFVLTNPQFTKTGKIVIIR